MHHEPTLTGLGGGRRTIVVAVLGALWTIGPFSIDLYLPALPSLAGDLVASQQQVALTVTAFFVGMAIGQVQAGALSDTHGRRSPLLAGLAVYAIASLACALAPSIEVLIAARFLQGIGGAAGMAISNAAVTDYVRGREAARLMSRLAMIGGVAPIVAPLAGAQLLRVMSWRGLFVVLATVGLTLFLSVLAGLPESLPRERRSSAGPRSLLRSLQRLSRDRRFMGYAAAGALSFAGFFAYLAGSSFVYQDVYGASPGQFSVLFAANAVGMLAASTVLGVLYFGDLPLWALATPLFTLVATMGFIIPDSTALALSLHPESAGTASAYFGTLRLGLGALATPAVGLAEGLDGVAMGLVIATAGFLALIVYGVVEWRDRGHRACEETPQGCADMTVG